MRFIANKHVVSIPLIMAMAVLSFAKGRPMPDLSGTWILNQAKSNLPKGTASRPETITITCTGATVQFLYESQGKKSTETYTTDGKEYIQNAGQGLPKYSKAEWKNSLLITQIDAHLNVPGNVILNGYPYAVLKQSWRLSKRGDVLYRYIDDDPRYLFSYDKQ